MTICRGRFMLYISVRTDNLKQTCPTPLATIDSHNSIDRISKNRMNLQDIDRAFAKY
ncbi:MULTISPECIES: hypothetical protein [unclassified Chamaesiphon]|uniref:hypothetical protein n=1 Tax=unclassified Chamaesiphon TaxID=2620921 RepID=UPI00286D0D6E|nr:MULTISPECIES: hypothetical protein [unclassified Chamaesiphon]